MMYRFSKTLRGDKSKETCRYSSCSNV